MGEIVLNFSLGHLWILYSYKQLHLFKTHTLDFVITVRCRCVFVKMSEGMSHVEKNIWIFMVLVKLYTTSPQKVAKEGKSPYFREIQVGEIL